MTKYEEHGLTRLEDDILGQFGVTEDFEAISARSFTPEHRIAFNSLVRKGLLDRKHGEHESVTYVLTPKGRKLWDIRTQEEIESPLPPGVKRL